MTSRGEQKVQRSYGVQITGVELSGSNACSQAQLGVKTELKGPNLSWQSGVTRSPAAAVLREQNSCSLDLGRMRMPVQLMRHSRRVSVACHVCLTWYIILTIKCSAMYVNRQSPALTPPADLVSETPGALWVMGAG